MRVLAGQAIRLGLAGVIAVSLAAAGQGFDSPDEPPGWLDLLDSAAAQSAAAAPTPHTAAPAQDQTPPEPPPAATPQWSPPPRPHSILGPRPFYDSFDGFAPSPELWWLARGVSIRPDGALAPTPPLAIVLGGALTDGAELVTMPLGLEDVQRAVLAFYVRPPADRESEPLIIEFFSPSQQWVKLLHLPPAAVPDADVFEPRVVELPDEAVHRATQLRFRTSTSGGRRAWSLDDVQIVAAPVGLILSEQSPHAVALGVDPADLFGEAEARGAGLLWYERPTTVLLHAPLRSGGACFERWVIDGIPHADGLNELRVALGPGVTSATAEYALLGDLNGDGALDRDDLYAFVRAVTDPLAFDEDFPEIDRVRRGDINGDGKVDNQDIEPFVELMLRP